MRPDGQPDMTNADDREVTRLLEAARVQGVRALNGRPADPDALHELATAIRGAVFEQVERKLWAAWGVETLADVGGLGVRARLGNPLFEPPVVIEWDWSRTKLPRLVVKASRPS